jgi:hypothetical protein
VIDLKTVSADQVSQYGVKEGTRLITYDFVLVTEEESKALREKNAMDAMEKFGLKMKLWNGLPVPDVD